MNKHKILAGNTAPWLRTALTRVQDRLADDVAEQIKNMLDKFPKDQLYVLAPPAVAALAGIGYGDIIHDLPVFTSDHVGTTVVLASAEGLVPARSGGGGYRDD